MNKTPKVSICIPAYNRRDMLRCALWSVLNQTYQDFEVIVSDNNSEEDIASEVTAFNDSRLRYIQQTKNIGGAANFIFLQTVVRGDYVLYLCSDDLLLPDCVEKAVNVLESDPERGGVIYRAAYYSEKGLHYISSLPNIECAEASDFFNDASVRECMAISPSVCLYRRAAFERVGGWNPTLLAIIDWDLYSRVIQFGGGVVFLHEVLAIMRLHEDQHSNNAALHWDFYHDKMLLFAQIEWRFGHKNQAIATALVEQLLWDWRLRRAPWKTLKHAYSTKAFPGVIVHLPWEVVKRIIAKLRIALDLILKIKTLPSRRITIDPGTSAIEKFWQISETVRMSRVSI